MNREYLRVNLLGTLLQKAGLAFISAKARHIRNGAVRVDEIVCATHEDAALVDAWAAKEGYPVVARVATPEELAEHKRFEELL
jgi:hypothetical protein